AAHLVRLYHALFEQQHQGIAVGSAERLEGSGGIVLWACAGGNSGKESRERVVRMRGEDELDGSEEHVRLRLALACVGCELAECRASGNNAGEALVERGKILARLQLPEAAEGGRDRFEFRGGDWHQASLT